MIKNLKTAVTALLFFIELTVSFFYMVFWMNSQQKWPEGLQVPFKPLR
jgi:hypothetical protein